jgi:hypothetical protein
MWEANCALGQKDNDDPEEEAILKAEPMKTNPRMRNTTASVALTAALSLTRIVILAASLQYQDVLEAAAQESSAGITHFRVTNQVVLSNVTRLGINLGEQTYYDSGQMTRNLLYRNPGFEGMEYRSILHCLVGGAGTCIDSRHAFQWPAGFWDGARYEVLDGSDSEQRGSVTTSGPSRDGNSGGYRLSLDGRAPISAGDWLAVSKEFPGDPASGWWPSVHGGAHLEAERKDLSPLTAGRQALRIEAGSPGQSAEIKSYFDSTEGRSFVRIKGAYRLRFRARSLSGTQIIHVSVKRIANPARVYLDRDIPLTRSWGDYRADFNADEQTPIAAPVEVSFSVNNEALLLDDVDLEQTSGSRSNGTAFRDEVVDTLKDLHPGVIRLMSSHSELGSTISNLLKLPMARQRSGFSTWASSMEDIPVGVPEFLELCSEVGAEPWIVAPTAMSREEARELAEYLAGSASTPGGAIRAGQGRRDPWTRAFRTIHIELGNETWNGIFQGETIEDAAAYGRRANQVFGAFRAAAGSEAAQFDLVVGAFTAVPDRNSSLLTAASQADSLAIAPYLMHSVTHWKGDDDLYGPLLAQPEQMSRNGVVRAAHLSARGRQLAVYEVNLHTTEGTAPADVLDRFTPSAAAGIAVTGHMLRMMRDQGVRDEMLFSLSQFEFKRGDGTPVRLWGSVVEMGGRARPQLITEALANRAMRGDMVRVEVTGENPTRDQPLGNDGVQLKSVHELDAYAFHQGNSYGLILFNYGLHTARAVSLEAPGINSRSSAKVWRLMHSGPGSSNEIENQVTVSEERIAGSNLSLSPCSMTVIEWQE